MQQIQQASQNLTLGELVFPIWLKNLGETINQVANNQQITNKNLKSIQESIKNIDLELAFKYDIVDGASIKRRLQRIKIIVGQKSAPNWSDDIIKKWEWCVLDRLNMTKSELRGNAEFNSSNTVFDVMDKIPEFRKIGVDILAAFERKYNIPPAIYTVEQVRRIGVLRRELDQSIVRCLSDEQFKFWVAARYMEIGTMFSGFEENPKEPHGMYGEFKLYSAFAKLHPELIPEKQLKYISDLEMVNIINRAINDKDIVYRQDTGVFFPLSNRKYDTSLLKDSFIDIVLRMLIV